MKQFEVGHRYYMRSIGDHDCIWSYEVIARTKATITLRPFEAHGLAALGRDGDRTYRIIKKVSEYRQAESVYPLGQYSMCPILSADHTLQETESNI